MALRFMDGFDHYATADLGKRWQVVSGTAGSVAINGGTGRRSTASARFTSASGAGGGPTVLVLNFAAQATWIFGCAIQPSAYPTVEQILLELYDASNTQIDVRLQTSGLLTITRGGTLLGTSSTGLATGIYTYLEWATTIHNTTGSTSLRFNGASVLTLTTLDTQATANATATTVRFGLATRWGGATPPTVDFDDVYLCDGTGSAPHNTFLGDCRVDTLLPASDGTHQQWTPSTPGTHYTLVDETAPNTTDYVSSSTVGQRDTYSMQDLTAVTGTIYAVQIALAALKSDAGARSIKPLLLSAASEALGAATALATGQTYTLHQQATDPATGAAWTESAVNAMQCGAEVA